MPRFIVDIRTRCNADAAYHGSQLVGHIIAVQIQRGNHGIFFGDKQRVLQECIGNAVLDDQTPFCQLFTKLTFCQLVPPLLETAFRKFHDVSFVYQGHGRQMMLKRVLAGGTHQALCSFS